jgi:hypothetical protein
MDDFYKKHEAKHKLAQYENYMLLEYQEGLLPNNWWLNPWSAVRQLQSALDKSVACYQRLFTKNENVYCDLAWVYQHTIAEGESTNAQDHYDSAGRAKQIVRVLEDNKKKINCLEAECKRLREASFVTNVSSEDYKKLEDKYGLLKYNLKTDIIDENDVYVPPFDFCCYDEPIKKPSRKKPKAKAKRKSKPKTKNKRK